jgi:2-methylene-furan-3-one reductase
LKFFPSVTVLTVPINMQTAWFYEEYGPKEALKQGDFPVPTPLHNQLLVQVLAAALNPIDFKRRQRPIFPSDFPVSRNKV